MSRKLLPIGSIVKIKQVNILLMISANKYEKNNKQYDYQGLYYPYGFIANDVDIIFNDDDIEKVFFIGKLDFLSKAYLNKLQKEE